MVGANENYLKLSSNYLFKRIGQEIAAFRQKNPSAEIISLGIGDVTQPIPAVCIDAMKKAADEMGDAATMRGYAPDAGYAFLIDAILKNDYAARGVSLDADEIFVSDGAKCDVGNIQEIFAQDALVAVPDPVYPVYRDTNIMAGREIEYLPCRAENNFAPALPEKSAGLIYLCSPNNPTGAALTKDRLAQWVAYAREHDAVIIFDSAYKEYISDPAIPHSIYEIDGAKEVAIELRSFSKTAGFTGVRCAYMVVPKEIKLKAADGSTVLANALWRRRHSTKFNGVAYIVQRAAEAVYSPEGKKQVAAMVGYYMNNAKMIYDGLKAKGFTVFGGVDAPYIWLKTPQGVSSEDFFKLLLEKAHLVCTPGSGFGACGEGYVRLTAFGSKENTQKAIARIGDLAL